MKIKANLSLSLVEVEAELGKIQNQRSDMYSVQQSPCIS